MCACVGGCLLIAHSSKTPRGPPTPPHLPLFSRVRFVYLSPAHSACNKQKGAGVCVPQQVGMCSEPDVFFRREEARRGGREREEGGGGGGGGRVYLETRAVGEEGLRGLGVVMATVADSAAGGADGETPAVELVARPVAVLGRLVHNLYVGQGTWKFKKAMSRTALGTNSPHDLKRTRSRARVCIVCVPV